MPGGEFIIGDRPDLPSGPHLRKAFPLFQKDYSNNVQLLPSKAGASFALFTLSEAVSGPTPQTPRPRLPFAADSRVRAAPW